MKIIRNKYIPFKGFKAINLFGVLFVKGDARIDDVAINHEKIHTAQMKELLYILFYAWYAIEWIIRMVEFRNSYMAYRNISFEREAYQNQEDTHYLKSRRLFNFLKYM